MTTSSLVTETAAAKRVRVTDEALIVELRDGRSVSVPLKWYPRLAEGRPREQRKWELIGPGIGIHWPELDEDYSAFGQQDRDNAGWPGGFKSTLLPPVEDDGAGGQAKADRETHTALSCGLT